MAAAVTSRPPEVVAILGEHDTDNQRMVYACLAAGVTRASFFIGPNLAAMKRFNPHPTAPPDPGPREPDMVLYLTRSRVAMIPRGVDLIVCTLATFLPVASVGTLADYPAPLRDAANLVFQRIY